MATFLLSYPYNKPCSAFNVHILNRQRSSILRILFHDFCLLKNNSFLRRRNAGKQTCSADIRKVRVSFTFSRALFFATYQRYVKREAPSACFLALVVVRGMIWMASEERERKGIVWSYGPFLEYSGPIHASLWDTKTE